MPTPRSQLVSLADTPWYHCVSRCVRRAWLCGIDTYTNQDYSHRRQWVVDRLDALTQAFAIDVATYAIMSNHYHVVLRVDADQAAQWTWQEVVEQWHRLYHGNMVSKRFIHGEDLSASETRVLKKHTRVWRQRLSDISWFMSALNEHIARRANEEDNVTGKYWEARFKSQALLDEQAILACSVYVDLNPIRAMMAETPEDSDYTSIQRRIESAKEGAIPKSLQRFQGPEVKHQQPGLPCALKDYIELVEATGKIVRDDKRGAIDARQSPILRRLKIDPDTWHLITTTFEDGPSTWVGSPERVKQTSHSLDRHWICQSATIHRLYPK